MKILRTVLLVIFAMCSMACGTSRLVDGWYPVAEGSDDLIEGCLIMAVSDFAAISIDTVTFPGHPIINGRVNPDKLYEWSEATKNRVGKRIGFVFKGKVVMAPKINCPIESGTFTIETSDSALTLDLYNALKSEI